MIIYKITNVVNNKIYIGCTIRSIETRFYRHWMCRFDDTIFARALQKYGKESFVCEVIENAPDYDTMYEREKYWITFYKSRDTSIGYNMTEGGRGGPLNSGKDHPRYGTKNPSLSKRNRELLGKTYEELYGKEKAVEIKTKIAEGSKNKKHSDESKLKCSIAKKQAWADGVYDSVIWSIYSKGRISVKRVPVKCVNNNIIYESQLQAGKELGVSPSNISSILYGRLKQTKGYSFEYAKI